MADLSLARRAMSESIEAGRQRSREFIRTLYERPEVGGEERRSTDLALDILSEADFSVVRGQAGLPTAFVAERPSRAGRGTRVAFMVELDALPGIGHACGHNASAAASLAAATSLATSLDVAGAPGTVMAVGTPGEENLSAKVMMLEAGVFRDVDAALMVHAFDKWVLHARSWAIEGVQFDFHGRPAHAAYAPDNGINALDATMLTFAGVNALRQHVPQTTRIHGIVTDGGQAPNVVPHESSARMYVRAESTEQAKKVRSRVEDCARGAALATGCRLDLSSFEPGCDSLNQNPVLLEHFAAHGDGRVGSLAAVPELLGSTDMGNVTRALPGIHPLMQVSPPGVKIHTPEFAAATITAEALEAVLLGAYAMAATGLDLAVDPELLGRVREAFHASL